MEFNKRDVKIYVIAGHAREGKTTTANLIGKYYGNKSKKWFNLAFAYPIKEYAKKISDWDGCDETKPRELLQQLGTDLIRKEIDNDFFINRIIEDIKVFSYFFDIITIDDARFDLEITSIKQAFPDSIIIKIEKPDSNQVIGKLAEHATEKGLINTNLYDYIIQNDGSLEDLAKKIELIVEG